MIPNQDKRSLKTLFYTVELRLLSISKLKHDGIISYCKIRFSLKDIFENVSIIDRKPRNIFPTMAALSTLDRVARLFQCQGSHHTAGAKSRPNSWSRSSKEIGHRGLTSIPSSPLQLKVLESMEMASARNSEIS